MIGRHAALASASALATLAACSSSTTTGATGADGAPPPGAYVADPILPAPTGTCPAIVSGDVTFAPAGMPPRKVKLALDDSATAAAGPLVLYWHATGSNPNEASYSLGTTENAIVAAGGVVAAPYPDPTAGQFEWFIVNQKTSQDDFILADEVVGCLVAAHRIDPHHIHSMGMSAGALQTSAISYVRSNYIASVATYSGGMPAGFAAPTRQRDDNKFAALIFDGGFNDTVFGVDFQAASTAYASALTSSGHYAELCNHGMGHQIPLDAAPSVVAFFAANGFGAWPSPYASAGLPATFPTYCAR